MLGFFIDYLEEDGEITKISSSELTPGSAVVAIEDVEDLKLYGVSTKIRFGIATENNTIICQWCVRPVPARKIVEHTPHFKVLELSQAEFKRGGLTLYAYPEALVKGNTNNPGMESERRAEVLKRARGRMGERSTKLRSFPGDDFVYECITGKNAIDIMAEHNKFGDQKTEHFNGFRHYLNSFSGLCEKVKIIGDLANKLGKFKFLQLVHHGIRIEGVGVRVIHFSSRRMKERSTCIKTDRLDKKKKKKKNGLRLLRVWAEKRQQKKAEKRQRKMDAKLKKETQQNRHDRLICRNRAVWVFCHDHEWGKYNLFMNNCEHFESYCRSGELRSRQVEDSVVSFLPIKSNEQETNKEIADKFARFNATTTWQDKPLQL